MISTHKQEDKLEKNRNFLQNGIYWKENESDPALHPGKELNLWPRRLRPLLWIL
jgi:hypothetical protein